VPLTIIVTAMHITEHAVLGVSIKVARLNLLNLVGRLQVIRKNLCVIVVDLDQSTLVKLWYITRMAIYTTPVCVI
jgi:hypothetical protein